MMNKQTFVIEEIKKETEDVVTIFLEPVHGDHPVAIAPPLHGRGTEYKAGQYMIVNLENEGAGHGKMYTISSAPHEERIALSIKKVGKFSSALHELKVGDALYLTGPCGHFYPTDDMRNIVFLASGIGITPFLSIIKAEAQKPTGKNVTLYYSNKTLADIAFFDELTALAREHAWLTVHHHLTRDDTPHEMVSSHRRIAIADIKDSLSDFTSSNFYLCGAIGFVRDMRTQLLAGGINEDTIFTESFF